MAKPQLREKPEQQFFDGPAIDRLMGYAFALSAEVYVLRERLGRLEDTLVAKGALKAGEVESLKRTPEQEAAVAQDRNAFIAALMENIVARQKSNSLG